jgi:DNA (cytosine-5)-methyltransferase 1
MADVGRIGFADRAAHEPSQSTLSRPDGEHPLRVLSLFAGIGGFDLGLERTGGFKTAAFCEIDPFCRRVLAKHWPEVPCYHDVRELTAERLAADGIVPNVIVGGFPCQDISFAGKGAGLAGERSGLWFDYARLIGELRPRYVIVENVGALLSRGLDAVLGTLASLGYDAEWHCIPASAVGAPHQRDRLWIVAYPAEERLSEAWKLRYNQLAQWLSRRGETSFPANDRKAGAKGLKPQEVSGFPAFSWCQNVRGPADLRGRPDIPPPLFRGSRDGIPDWVDRVGSPGNAVVPQIPELIGRAILAAIADRNPKGEDQHGLRAKHESGGAEGNRPKAAA